MLQIGKIPLRDKAFTALDAAASGRSLGMATTLNSTRARRVREVRQMAPPGNLAQGGISMTDLLEDLRVAAGQGMTTAIWAGENPNHIAVVDPDGTTHTFKKQWIMNTVGTKG